VRDQDRYYEGDKIKDYGKGRACSMQVKYKKHINFLSESLKGRDMEYLDVDGMIMMRKWNFKQGTPECVGLIWLTMKRLSLHELSRRLS
jgi:hypothetical protein